MHRLNSKCTAAFFALGVGFAAPVAAQQGPVVVELFTSQGCSSCPPADAILSELTGRDDVIAIALHVDYWDYIGWKDEFAEPAFAVRQRAYAAKAGRRSIYTPEMVVNGQTDIVGAKPMVLSKAIADHKATAPILQMTTQRDSNTVRIQADVPTVSVAPMEIHLLHVTPVQSTRITRGENRGKTIEYTNIAHDWQVAGTWNGQAPLDLVVNVTGSDPIVVLIQEAGVGQIIAATRID